MGFRALIWWGRNALWGRKYFVGEGPSLDQINFEMLHISKLSFCRKMRFSAESTPRCGALHSHAALEHLTFKS
ncbi:hypothetical protein KL86DES1_10506 [uncultured Desulfovibrio sp.]|uniref:Uncharacterized protein n=1 Tax=uncultured Desulfovibrio sp. TaxID=167968 RepID=A0A212KZN6_9BACT|nr:hypothetical protein KL86DES1_10506 [uncultured Desulfovibrio sp.]VZH32380.1 conserved protein of unknown function [Desulfovibrio sp. 86]